MELLSFFMLNVTDIATWYTIVCRVLLFTLILPAYPQLYRETKVSDELKLLRQLIFLTINSFLVGQFVLLIYQVGKSFLFIPEYVSAMANIISASTILIIGLCVCFVYLKQYKEMKTHPFSFFMFKIKTDLRMLRTFFVAISLLIFIMVTAMSVMFYGLSKEFLGKLEDIDRKITKLELQLGSSWEVEQ